MREKAREIAEWIWTQHQLDHDESWQGMMIDDVANEIECRLRNEAKNIILTTTFNSSTNFSANHHCNKGVFDTKKIQTENNGTPNRKTSFND